jgi:hypothetical protein
MVNAEDIRRVIKFMEESPENWDQRHWGSVPHEADWTALPGMVELRGGEYVATEAAACGTTMCFAGFTAAVNGYTAVFEQGIAVSASVIHPVTGEVEATSTVARGLLGLSKESADMLFHRVSLDSLDEYKKWITTVTGVRFDGE